MAARRRALIALTCGALRGVIATTSHGQAAAVTMSSDGLHVAFATVPPDCLPALRRTIVGVRNRHARGVIFRYAGPEPCHSRRPTRRLVRGVRILYANGR